MQTLAWEQLFRFIPEQHRNNLSIITRAGVEFNVQMLLRIESECVAIRGRLAGSQDAGRIFFIPYETIDHVGFIREMRESEFAEIFDTFQFPGRAVPPTPQTIVVAEELIAPSSANSPASRMSIPIKSEVLERFRGRNGNGVTLNGRLGADNNGSE